MTIPPAATEGGYNLSPQAKQAFDTNKLKRLAEWKPTVVVIGAMWTSKYEQDAAPLLEYIRDYGGSVLLIEDPPLLPCGDRNALQWLASENINPLPERLQYVPNKLLLENEGGREVVRRLANQFSHVDFLPTYDLFISDHGVLALDGSESIYLDDDHLLQAGSERVVPRLAETLAKFFRHE